MDSAYYTAAVIAAIRRNGARFSVTAPVTAAIRAAISVVPETSYTAFTSKKKELHVTARLVIRRVRDKNPKAAPGQGELFPAWRCHAVFTATVRRDLVAVAARTARRGRNRITLRLPEGWHREREWLNLFEAACGPPAAAA